VTDRRPAAAFALGLVGGLLILIEGIFLFVLGSIVGSAGYTALGGLAVNVGILGGIAGVLILLLSIAVFARPDDHVGLGILILVASVLAILVGGGFYIGSIFGVIGGVMAIRFQEASPRLRYVTGAAGPAAPIPDRSCVRCGKVFSGDGRDCPFCHAAP